MKGLWGELLQGVVSLAAAVCSFLAMPWLVTQLRVSGIENVVGWAFFVIVYALIMSAVYVVGSVPAFRKLFDPRARLIGQYFSSSPTADSGIISFFVISFHIATREYTLRGTTVDTRIPKQHAGLWSSTRMDFNLQDHTVTYVYSGTGSDSRTAGADGGRELGFAVIEFADDCGSRGRVHYRDDHPHALYVESEVTRITPAMITEYLGVPKAQISSYEEMKDFALGVVRSKASEQT